MVVVKSQLKMQSDQDTDSSTAGASPRSFYIESPHSSPGQQVPYLTNYMTVLSCADNNLMDTGSKFLFDVFCMKLHNDQGLERIHC